MEVSAKELRMQPGKIIARVLRGIEVVITVRGKKLARLVPFDRKDAGGDDSTDELFGLWKSRSIEQSVDDEVRGLRKGRFF